MDDESRAVIESSEVGASRLPEAGAVTVFALPSTGDAGLDATLGAWSTRAAQRAAMLRVLEASMCSVVVDAAAPLRSYVVTLARSTGGRVLWENSGWMGTPTACCVG